MNAVPVVITNNKSYSSSTIIADLVAAVEKLIPIKDIATTLILVTTIASLHWELTYNNTYNCTMIHW